MAARARDPRRLHPAGARAADLRPLLSAALPHSDSAQGPDRGRRQRPERAEPRHRPDAGRQRRGESGRRAETLAEARAALDRGEAFAVVGIPPGTQRDMLKGITAHLPIYADATYLFIFRSTGNGIAAAINTLSSELAAGGARTDGSLVKASLAATEPGRHPAAADLQPGRRLRQLHRARGLRADPAADAVDRRGDADRRRAGAGEPAAHSRACSAAASRI